MDLETMDLDGLSIKLEAFLLIGEELLNIFALITLKLNHLSHLAVDDDSAIASKFLLDDLEDLLLIELLGKTLDGCQSLTTIALLNTNVNVILRLLGLSCVFVGLGEGVESLKVLNGHKSDECVLDSLVVFCGKGDPKLVGGAVMCV